MFRFIHKDNTGFIAASNLVVCSGLLPQKEKLTLDTAQVGIAKYAKQPHKGINKEESNKYKQAKK